MSQKLYSAFIEEPEFYRDNDRMNKLNEKLEGLVEMILRRNVVKKSYEKSQKEYIGTLKYYDGSEWSVKDVHDDIKKFIKLY